MDFPSPDVTVIVPVFNRADIVAETIESILSQDMSSWELILVDDGSTDDSIQVLDSYARRDSRISYCRRPSHLVKGANSCRNHGFSMARGKYVKWVDSDDLLTADALSSQLEFFTKNVALNVCFGQGEYFNSETRAPDGLWSRKKYSENMLLDYLLNQIRWPVGGPLWRRDYFTGDPFDVRLKNSQEWLMHALQLIRLKPDEYAILEKIIYKIRRGNLRMSSESNRTSRYFYNEFLARVIVFQRLNPSTPIRVKALLVKQMGIYYFHSIRRRFSRP